MAKRHFAQILVLLLLCINNVYASETDIHEISRLIENVTKHKNARIGVALVIDDTDTVTVNNETEYPLMSVFKLHQAVSVLHYLEQENVSLDSVLNINRREIVENTYSPLRDKYPDTDITVSLRNLLRYTLLMSDNNACDILFRHVIGVKETDKYVRSLGINTFSIVANEEEMHNDINLCCDNWSSPLATAELLNKVIAHDILNSEHKQFITETMVECETGKNRLRGFRYDDNVIVGNKTGTGDINENGEFIAVNDVGFFILPNKHRYTIAVFVKDSKETMEETEKIISEISEIVYLYIRDLFVN